MREEGDENQSYHEKVLKGGMRRRIGNIWKGKICSQFLVLRYYRPSVVKIGTELRHGLLLVSNLGNSIKMLIQHKSAQNVFYPCTHRVDGKVRTDVTLQVLACTATALHK